MLETSIAITLVVSAFFALLAKLIKQPPLLGYVIAGVFLSVTGLIQKDVATSFGHIGVALLLFTVGLSLSFKEVRELGGTVLTTGLAQIAITALVGFLLLVTVFHLPSVQAFYIAIALTFSSTVIMVKLLTERNDQASLYGKITIGLLLVQDFVAIALIVFLTTLSNGSGADYIILFSKAVALVLGVILLSRTVIPFLIERFIADSPELLFIVSIAWGLGFAAFVAGPVGLSLEIGGLLAGLSLSALPENLQISSMVKPIREFFLTLFFVALGSLLSLSTLVNDLPQAIILSIFVLVGSPLIMLFILGRLGYSRRTAFFVGLATAQVSEFSFVILNIGLTYHHVTSNQVSLVVLVALITMTVSTYLFMGSDVLYNSIEKYLSFFEKKKTREKKIRQDRDLSGHFIVVGCGRTGQKVVTFLKKHDVPIVVVDFDPSTFEFATNLNVDFVFGDITDREILSTLHPESAKMIISTIPGKSENMALVEEVRKVKKAKVPLLVMGTDRQNESKLLTMGADIVTIPSEVAGKYLTFVLRSYLKNARLPKQ